MGELEGLLKLAFMKFGQLAMARYGWGWTLAGAFVGLVVLSLVVHVASIVYDLVKRSLQRLATRYRDASPLIPTLRVWWSVQFALHWFGIVFVFLLIAAVVKRLFHFDLIYMLGIGALGLISLRIVEAREREHRGRVARQ